MVDEDMFRPPYACQDKNEVAKRLVRTYQVVSPELVKICESSKNRQQDKYPKNKRYFYGPTWLSGEH